MTLFLSETKHWHKSDSCSWCCIKQLISSVIRKRWKPRPSCFCQMYHKCQLSLMKFSRPFSLESQITLLRINSTHSAAKTDFQSLHATKTMFINAGWHRLQVLHIFEIKQGAGVIESLVKYFCGSLREKTLQGTQKGKVGVLWLVDFDLLYFVFVIVVLMTDGRVKHNR